MKNIFLIIKGFIMGIANVIPGVSGGTLALTLGIYEEFISAISNFFKNFKENIKFLIPIFIGMVLSILTMSNVISIAYDKFPLPTTLFFVGLVIGGVPLIYSNIKDDTKEKYKISNYFIALLTFSIVLFMALADKIFTGFNDVSLFPLSISVVAILFIVGIIASATMVIPGVSGSLVLMLLGFYYPIIDVIKDLTHFNNLANNFIVCAVFGIGVLLGIIVISKIIEFLFKKYKSKTYFGVLGFVLASIIAIPISSLSDIQLSISITQFIVSIICIFLGFAISYKLGEK